MNIETGREFPFKNPQDDPNDYPTPPSGFRYDLEGRLVAIPRSSGSSNDGLFRVQPIQSAPSRGRLESFPTFRVPTQAERDTHNDKKRKPEVQFQFPLQWKAPRTEPQPPTTQPEIGAPLAELSVSEKSKLDAAEEVEFFTRRAMNELQGALDHMERVRRQYGHLAHVAPSAVKFTDMMLGAAQSQLGSALHCQRKIHDQVAADNEKSTQKQLEEKPAGKAAEAAASVFVKKALMKNPTSKSDLSSSPED